MPKYRVPLERGAHAHVRIHLIQHSVKTRPRSIMHRRIPAVRGRISGAQKRRKIMKYPLTPLALGVALLLSSPARAADIDWKKVDAALGKTAAVSGEVHRYGLPRSDLHVTLDGVSIKPALALGGW